MKRRRHTPEQVIRKLAEGDKLLAEGKTIDEVARHLEITESTWHRWRNQYGGMKADDAKRLKELERENVTPEEDRGRPGLRHRHAEGVEPGKLLTPDRRRRAVAALQEQFGVSERRACRVVGQPRSTQRLAPPVPSDERAGPAGLPARLLAPSSPVGLEACGHGGQRAPAGWSTTSGSTACGEQKACVCPIERRSDRCRGIGVAVGAMCPIAPNVVWALDFQFDQTSDARMLKLLNVIDEYTRECLAIDIDRSIDADGVVRCLDRLAAERGAPRYVRFDHGPEFIAYAVADWCRFNGTDTVFIDPGSPWQNAWIEAVA